jgi:hypothetical protein
MCKLTNSQKNMYAEAIDIIISLITSDEPETQNFVRGFLLKLREKNVAIINEYIQHHVDFIFELRGCLGGSDGNEDVDNEQDRILVGSMLEASFSRQNDIIDKLLLLLV